MNSDASNQLAYPKTRGSTTHFVHFWQPSVSVCFPAALPFQPLCERESG